MWCGISKRLTPYLLHPRPAILIGSCSRGECSALVAAWVTPVSRDPPYIAVAIAPTRYTYSLLKDSGKFSVIVLPWDKLRNLHYLGTVSGREVKDKLSRSGLKWSISDFGVPVCEEALAYAECSLSKDVPCGDHQLVVGEVVNLFVKEGIDIGSPPKYDVPLHVRGAKYVRLSNEVVTLE